MLHAGLIVPALLSNVLFCVSFHWNVEKLGYLQQVLANVDHYPTHVETLLVTDSMQQLQEAVRHWQIRHRVRVLGPATSSYDSDTMAHKLVWEHKPHIEAAYKEGGARGAFTTFIYVEDDTFIAWPTLVSWAFDTEALAPLGFMRGFYRTEIHHDTGKLVLMDQLWKLDLASHNLTLHLNTSALFVCPASEHQWLRAWHPTAGQREPSNRTCLVHDSFIQLPITFMGMWIATRPQLQQFMNGGAWDKESALRYDMPVYRNVTFGYPERSTIFSQLASVPPGFESASVVPYDRSFKVLAQVGAISHLRNGYTRHGWHSSIPLEEFMQ